MQKQYRKYHVQLAIVSFQKCSTNNVFTITACTVAGSKYVYFVPVLWFFPKKDPTNCVENQSSLGEIRRLNWSLVGYPGIGKLSLCFTSKWKPGSPICWPNWYSEKLSMQRVSVLYLLFYFSVAEPHLRNLVSTQTTRERFRVIDGYKLIRTFISSHSWLMTDVLFLAVKFLQGQKNVWEDHSSCQRPMRLKLVILFPFRTRCYWCSYFAFTLCSFFVLVNFSSGTFKAGQSMPNYYDASFHKK